METNDDFINIGKYSISKFIMMSEPCQLYIRNNETNEVNSYYEFKVFELLRSEGLDPEPLHEYFDIINGTTKEERIKILKKYEEWERNRKEKKLMKQEDNKLKEEIKNAK